MKDSEIGENMKRESSDVISVTSIWNCLIKPVLVAKIFYNPRPKS